MITIRVGGVPEHFNLAWHLAIENGIFEQNGIKIEWVDVPGGTGAMCKALREGELDVAIALTEGMIKDIMQGNPSKMVQFYVNSPLRWGIFVNAQSKYKTTGDMPGLKYAISRFGSGSHLMAKVNASNLGMEISPESYVVVQDLAGARKALAENSAQLFMWEKFTTRPYVRNGEFRMIGECNTPWPCFVVAATNSFIVRHGDALNRTMEIVNQGCSDLKHNQVAPELIVNRYGINKEDAEQWFRELEYACDTDIEETDLRLILWRLKKFGIIDRIPALDEIIYTPHLELAGADSPE